MPEVICTTVYQFPELSDAAKDKARSWYRELGPHDGLAGPKLHIWAFVRTIHEHSGA